MPYYQPYRFYYVNFITVGQPKIALKMKVNQRGRWCVRIIQPLFLHFEEKSDVGHRQVAE
jgi:hypothetical protein